MCRQYIISFVFVLLLYVQVAIGQMFSYESFRNFSIDAKQSPVNCFAQDSLGMIWLGSNQGLYNFDGYSIRNASFGDLGRQTFVYDIVVLDQQYFVAATEQGIWLYDYVNDKYESFEEDCPKQVRTLLLDGEKLWIGTMNGLYDCDLKTKSISKILYAPLNTVPIYDIVKIRSEIVVGTYDGLYSYSTSSNSFKRIILPSYRQGNVFVNSLLPIPQENLVYVGTEYGLYQYNTSSAAVSKISTVPQSPIKSMSLRSDSTLLLGTDNGLYIYESYNDQIARVKHDSRDPKSIANNIIWGMFVDRDQTVWVGTDLGFSMFESSFSRSVYPIYSFTGTEDGNRFYNILRDKYGYYWLGGDNGLIRVKDFSSKAVDRSLWYTMDSKNRSIPHNRIRDIYQDNEGLVWIASDGGLSVFDEESEQFRSFRILDSSGTKNAKWAYNILDDGKGQLWVATYLGGVFILNKKDLLSSKTSTFICNNNINSSHGLPDNFANQIVKSVDGTIYLLVYKKGIYRVVDKNRLEAVVDERGKLISDVTYMISDSSGNIWVSSMGRLYCIASNRAIRSVVYDHRRKSEVQSMVDSEDAVWFVTDRVLWRVTKSLLSLDRINVGKNVSSLYYDKNEGKVWMGGVDQVSMMLSELPLERRDDHHSRIVLTGISISNVPLQKEGSAVRNIRNIDLDHDQNNLLLEFSDFNYAENKDTRFAYKIGHSEQKWIVLDYGDNTVNLANLSSGDLDLHLVRIGVDGKQVGGILKISLHVKYPWYLGVWAKLFYSLLMVALVLWCVNFFRVRHNLKLERIERKKILELTHMKMDFFTSLSHDLKTPLSLILAPLGQMIAKSKDVSKKQKLELIQSNALKINALVQEALEFEKIGEHSSKYIIKSRIELISFSKEVFQTFQFSEEYASIQFEFESSDQKIWIDSDVNKLRSILQNLLSNACKFTYREESRVSMRVVEEETLVRIQIEDNGVGIRKEDLPYVYTKYFRAANDTLPVEGTGVGLYSVKSHVEQLEYDLYMESTLGDGTKVSVDIPGTSVVAPDQEETTVNPLTENDHLKSVLIVEDNVELGQFLMKELSSELACVHVFNGKEAIELCANGFTPDIVLSDLHMPIMDGLEMVRRLRKIARVSATPIILLTANDDKELSEDAVTLGIDTIILKPFDFSFLMMKIRQLLAKSELIIQQYKIESIAKQTPIVQIPVSEDERFLVEITRLIEVHMDDSSLSIARLSDEMGIGQKQFYRKIKSTTGQTPISYLRNVRMKKAALLLQQNKFTISEIMYMVGFSNASYFSKCFQEEFGRTPSQYAKRE